MNWHGSRTHPPPPVNTRRRLVSTNVPRVNYDWCDSHGMRCCNVRMGGHDLAVTDCKIFFQTVQKATLEVVTDNTVLEFFASMRTLLKATLTTLERMPCDRGRSGHTRRLAARFLQFSCASSDPSTGCGGGGASAATRTLASGSEALPIRLLLGALWALEVTNLLPSSIWLANLAWVLATSSS